MTETIEFEITGMAFGGSAVGRHEGRAVFVPYTLPGERIRAEITQDKGRFANARLVDVLDASPERVVPRCIHFGVCGGCHWQHIDYAAQLRFKQQIVADQMRRIGGFQDAVVHPTIASPSPWMYRTHVTLHSAANGRPGFVTIDDRSILAIEECHIIRPELLEMVETSAPLNAERVRFQVGSGSDERLIARNTADDENISTESGIDLVHYTLRGKTFQVTGGSFFQVNLAQAETLVDQVMARLDLKGTEHILDLYSGVGLFTAFLAEKAKKVTAIETSPSAIADAKINLIGFSNVRMLEGAVETVLPGLQGKVQGVVVDPPRSGMKPAALKAMVQRKPARIVYVSCDPATLARDAKQIAASGYQLIDVQPVDMFPQTYHVESVASFHLSDTK